MKPYKCIAFAYLGLSLLCFHTHAIAQGSIRPVEPLQSDSSSRGRDFPNFFPLEVGNEWIYSDGTSSFEVQVLREIVEANNIKYFEISGYFQNDPSKTHRIRRGPSGQVLEYNPSGEDFLWYDFGHSQGAWRLESRDIIPCITGSLVTPGASNGTVETPAGTFEHTVRHGFLSPCADAGITSEHFANGAGLVQRVLTTIAGPRTYNLVSACIGSRELSVAGYGIEVSMDRPLYFNNLMPPIVNPWPTASVLFMVRNKTETPLEFIFSTSQRFDLIVRDALGSEVLRWSDGRAFAPVIGKETLLNQSLRYRAQITLKSREGKVLPEGLYTLTAYLTARATQAGTPVMSGTITFEVCDIH
jgi:hypothetical protein